MMECRENVLIFVENYTFDHSFTIRTDNAEDHRVCRKLVIIGGIIHEGVFQKERDNFMFFTYSWFGSASSAKRCTTGNRAGEHLQAKPVVVLILQPRTSCVESGSSWTSSGRCPLVFLSTNTWDRYRLT